MTLLPNSDLRTYECEMSKNEFETFTPISFILCDVNYRCVASEIFIDFAGVDIFCASFLQCVYLCAKYTWRDTQPYIFAECRHFIILFVWRKRHWAIHTYVPARAHTVEWLHNLAPLLCLWTLLKSEEWDEVSKLGSIHKSCPDCIIIRQRVHSLWLVSTDELTACRHSVGIENSNNENCYWLFIYYKISGTKFSTQSSLSTRRTFIAWNQRICS